MTTNEKQIIKDKLSEYCRLKGSQTKAANSLKGVSPATISQILNENWDLINDEMWRNIASQIGYERQNWVVVETRGFRRMYDLLTDAQSNSLVFAVKGEAGCGKTEAIKAYVKSNRNVLALSCSEYWNRKHFMVELLQSMGVDHTGCTVSEMMSDIIYRLKKTETPLIILDEADKLSDQVLYFFISLYNKLEDHCGIILCATDYLEKRVSKGVKINRKGYKEIFSRISRKFIPLQVINGEDIAAICLANGVSDQSEINSIIDDSECDLRRVKRRIHAYNKEKN